MRSCTLVCNTETIKIQKPLETLAVSGVYTFSINEIVRLYLIDISPLIRLLILWPMLCMGRWIRRRRAATAVATVHRTVAKSRLSNPSSQMPIPEKDHYLSITVFFLVGEDGFEPSKRYAADLQSVKSTELYGLFAFCNQFAQSRVEFVQGFHFLLHS